MRKQSVRNFIWCGIIVVVIAATALPAAHRAWRGHTGDFTHFWQAAHAMLHGENIYAAGDGRYVYPPLLAFLFQPLALLPEQIAAIIWIATNSLLVVTAVIIAAKQVAARWQIVPTAFLSIAAVAMILNIDKIRALLNLGQSDGLMLLAFAGVLCWMERSALLTGLAVGASANIKYVSLIFVPYFLLKRNYRAAVATVSWFVLLMLLPTVEVGLGRAAEYLRASIGGLAKMIGFASFTPGANISDVEWNRSVSVTSTMFRLTRANGWPDSIAILCAVFLSLIVIAVVGALLRRRTSTEPSHNQALMTLEWAALIVLALTFSPQTTSRHMVLMSLVYVVALAVLLRQRERRTKIILGGAIALMVGALTLPPYGIGNDQAVWTWREIGGASWCAIGFIFVLAWVGGRTLSAKVDVDLGVRPDPDPSSRSRL